MPFGRNGTLGGAGKGLLGEEAGFTGGGLIVLTSAGWLAWPLATYEEGEEEGIIIIMAWAEVHSLQIKLGMTVGWMVDGEMRNEPSDEEAALL